MARCLIAILTFAVLVVIAYARSKLPTFRKLSEKEVSANSTWAYKFTVLESGSVRLENSGPPASFSITPWPPVFNQMTYYELNFTAAYSMHGGEVSYYANIWPYEIHFDACEYIRQQLGIMTCPLKKGETYMYQGSGRLKDNNFDVLPNKGHLIGNMTVTNDDGDVILCVSLNVKLPI